MHASLVAAWQRWLIMVLIIFVLLAAVFVAFARTFLWDAEVAGKTTQFRYNEVQVSPTLYTYRAETLVGGGPWTVIAEGKITKVR
jgi:hypothetical protein